MKEAFAGAFSFPPMRALITNIAIISAFGFSYSVLSPIFARDVFGGDARVLGYLMSASGIGALAGALYLGNRKSIRGLGNVVATGGILMGAGLIAFACSRQLPLSLVCLGIMGLGGVLTMASSNTLVQTLVEENRRGRVMAIFTMAFTGTMPLGNLLMGWLSRFSGPGVTLIICGTICVVAALNFLQKLPRLREQAAPLLDRVAPIEVVS